MKNESLIIETVKDLGRELETLCGAGWNVEELEISTGIDRERVADILHGDGVATVAELVAIAHALGADLMIVKRQ